MNLGTAIRKRRKTKAISQKNLASSCGISANALCQIELNNNLPKKKTLERIASELGVTISYLLFMAISNDDISEEKKDLFNALKQPLENALLNS
jgi:transcriptional regulator with XRE-family HTH domain